MVIFTEVSGNKFVTERGTPYKNLINTDNENLSRIPFSYSTAVTVSCNDRNAITQPLSAELQKY